MVGVALQLQHIFSLVMERRIIRFEIASAYRRMVFRLERSMSKLLVELVLQMEALAVVLLQLTSVQSEI